MGKIIIIFCLTIQFSNSSLSQWFDINPVPDGNVLYDMSFINDTTGWLVGSWGLIMKTTNTGLKWIKKTSGTNQHLITVHFENENVGWCAGASGIVLKTEDGGESWNIVSNLPATVTSLHFINENIGWAVGVNGLIEKTTDGGNSWTLQNYDESYSLRSVFFISEQKGFAIGGNWHSTGVFFSTSDGGQSWEIQNKTNSLNTVFFINDSIGWISGYDEILKTTDAGNNWEKIYGFDYEYYGDIYFLDENNGYIIYEGLDPDCANVVKRTTDGGYTWQTGSGLYVYHLHTLTSGCLFVNNDGKGIVAASRGTIAMTFDYGINWNLIYSGNDELETRWLSIYSEETKGAIVYNNNYFLANNLTISKPLKDSDYWILDYINSSGTWRSKIQFVNDTLGFAGAGDLYRTSDSGNSWHYFEFGGGADIFFIDDYNGWLSGEDSELFRTTDGAYNWTFLGNFYPLDLGRIYFLNSDIGFSGKCKTTDGGCNWYEVGGGIRKCFINDSTGFGVNDNGEIWKTIDIGESWYQINSGTNEDLFDIYFINESRGYAVGNNGTILVTTNGGYSWNQQESGTNDNLFNVDFVDENEGYVIGQNGAFLKTVNSGGIIPVELISLTAITKKGNVLLNWATATETNNLGFEIERRIEDGQFETIGFVEGHGTTTETQNYQFIDDISNLHATSLSYRLKQVDYDGSYEYSDVVEVTNPAPTDFALQQNYPNPFNPTTKIGFGVEEKTNVKIVVINSIGEEVAVILNKEMEPGFHQVEFNGANLTSGVYFYQLKAGSFVETKKMLLIK